MKNALRYSDKKFVLIGKISGLASQTKRARNLIVKAKTQKAISDLMFRKYTVGIDVRHHLLAYAFLRGVPYKSVEKTCAENNKPLAKLILKLIEDHAPTWVRSDLSAKMERYEFSANDVDNWLAGGC